MYLKKESDCLVKYLDQMLEIVIASVKNNAVLTLAIMTRGCESKQANSRCQNHA
jgi:hypothetical protein